MFLAEMEGRSKHRCGSREFFRENERACRELILQQSLMSILQSEMKIYGRSLKGKDRKIQKSNK